MTVVLDSWAVLRLLEGVDPAASRVEALLEGDDSPVMSWINLGEVAYVVERVHGADEADRVVRDLRPLLRLDDATQDRVLAAARIKATYLLAYADAFAAATALAHDAVLLTGDPELLGDTQWATEDLR